LPFQSLQSPSPHTVNASGARPLFFMSSFEIALIDTLDAKRPRLQLIRTLYSVPQLDRDRSLEGAVIRSQARSRARLFALLFAQASLALAFLFYPVFLHLGAHNGSQETLARDQFDFCGQLTGEPAQSCGVSSRFLVRAVQAAAGDPRACAQASRVTKFIYHPLRRSSWDETSLNVYATYYWQSGQLSKWLKARVAEYMLNAHHAMDANCNP
jgi:hypothetical protein